MEPSDGYEVMTRTADSSTACRRFSLERRKEHRHAPQFTSKLEAIALASHRLSTHPWRRKPMTDGYIEKIVAEPVEGAVQAPSPAKRETKVACGELADLADEADSFERQRKLLLKMARLLKRVPTVDEALKFIQDNGLFTGTWANPARRGRVRGILKFIAKTFDPKKC